MIPSYINSSPSPFPSEPSGDHDQHHQFFVPNYQSASSSSVPCHVFFNTPQDQSEYYHTVMHQPVHHQQEVENQAGSTYDFENKESKSLKLTLWKNEKQIEENPSKWMSSKMRLMQKMKNTAVASNSTTTTTTVNLEDQKQASSSFETDHFSSNPTVRVCADCNTTKTPLWRSGPKGPKSLCNACGIRQRKARRAMAAAAAAAAANGTNLKTMAPETATLKIKVQNKDKIKINGQATQFKKKCKLTAGESSHHHAPTKQNVFEDFLFNLSKNLAFHRVFPQDEKEAAILLMALSCGLVHG